jgi:hypothetical protein
VARRACTTRVAKVFHRPRRFAGKPVAARRVHCRLADRRAQGRSRPQSGPLPWSGPVGDPVTGGCLQPRSGPCHASTVSRTRSHVQLIGWSRPATIATAGDFSRFGAQKSARNGPYIPMEGYHVVLAYNARFGRPPVSSPPSGVFAARNGANKILDLLVTFPVAGEWLACLRRITGKFAYVGKRRRQLCQCHGRL